MLASFFHHLYHDAPPNSFYEIRALNCGPRGQLFVNTYEGLLAGSALSRRYPHTDFYFGVQPRHGKVGTAKAISSFVAVYADLDVGENKFYHTASDARQAIKRAVPPSAVVGSGGGYHIYYFLEKAVGIDRLQSWRAACVALGEHLNGDIAVCDASRILRLPGTLNYKLKDKPRPVELVSLSGIYYRFDDLVAELGSPSNMPSVLPTTPITSFYLASKVEALLPLLPLQFEVLDNAVRIASPCPLCNSPTSRTNSPPRGTAWISKTTGRFKCWREGCPAGPKACGVNNYNGYSKGLSLTTWVGRFYPEFLYLTV